MNNPQHQELSFKQKLKKPIFKYGCLPLLALFLLFIIVIFSGNGKKIDFNGSNLDSKTIVNDFCTLPIDDLEIKYGKATNEFGSYDWTLNKEHNIRVMVFEEGNKRDVARFFNFDLGVYFWETLGWDKNNLDLNNAANSVTISNLSGIDEATLKERINILNIKLSGETYNFGKLK